MRKTPLKKYNKKSVEKRKEERKNYPEFYKENIRIIKDNNLCCAECGCKLIGDVSEVAHILEKQKFKSISCLFENIVYLCSYKSVNNCHSLFDGSNEQLQGMKIFPETKEKVKQLLEKVEETYNWKIIDRWQL